MRSDGIGKSLRAISTAVALFLCTVTCSLSLPDGPKPLRIVASYHDLENIRHYTPARNDYWHEIFIRRRGGGRADTCNIAPAEFQNYSCVILAGGTAKIRTAGDKISPDETAEIVGFMEQGGVLVVAFPSYMRSFRAAFGEVSAKIRIVSHQTRRSFRVEEPAHPLVDLGNAREEDQGQDEAEDDAIDALLEADEGGENLLGGAPVEAMDPSRMISSSFSVLKFDGAESLAGDGPNSCYMIIPVGRGRLILAPQEVFPDYSMAQLMDSDGVARDMKLMALKKRQRLAANLFRFLSPPRIGDVISDTCAEGPRVRFWYRDIPTITTEGPERMNPPVPRPGEEVAELTMDVGQTEWERRIFYMTLNRPVVKLSATLSELRGASGVLDPDSSELLALLPPTETFSGPFVYLGKQQDLPPAGQPFVTVDRPASVLWCLRIHVEDAEPGEYEGRIEVEADGERFELPVRVTVWPVRLDRRYIEHDVEQFFLTRYDYRQSKMAGKLADYTAALDDFREHWVNWALGGVPGYAELGGVLREDGRDLAEAIKSDPEQFSGETAPMLDLSGQDTFFHLLIEKNMTVFRTYQLNADLKKVAELAAEAYGNTNLTVDSPEIATLATYWMREHGRYLREKGFPRIYTKLFDEWGESGLAAFLREARIAKAAGWRVIANPNQQAILENIEHRDKVWSLTDCWWYAYGGAFLKTAREMDEAGQLAGNEFWRTQTSSYWWNIAVQYGYQAGWELADLGFPGHHFHGWKRDPPGGVWLDTSRTPYGIFPCVGYEFLGEGLEEGQYLAMLKEMMEVSETDSGGTAAIAADVKSRLRAILGPGEDSILGFHELSKDAGKSLVGMGWDHRQALVDFHHAKRELLKLLVEVKATVPDPGVDLKWGERYLVKDGHAAAGVMVGPGTPYAGILNGVVEEKTGVVLEGAGPEAPGLLVAIGARGEAWLDDLVAGHPRCGVTATYPRPGSYLIYPVPDGKTILIVGGNAAGAELGTRNFTRFLEVRKGWKVK